MYWGDIIMKNEYLNEQNYQKSKKKLSVVGIVILLVGCIIGCCIIGVGCFKMNGVNAESLGIKSASVVQEEIDALNEEIIPLKAKMHQESSENAYSEEYYRTEYELEKKEAELVELESELRKIESGYYDTMVRMAKSKHIPLTLLGGFVIIVSLMLFGVATLLAKRREIVAFTTQQVMPIAKEGAETMASTASAFAKEVAKGVKEGLDEKEE